MPMRSTSEQINTLKQQVARLKQSCEAFDKQKLFKHQRFVKNQHGLFEHHLFNTRSTRLMDYLNEVISQIDTVPDNERRHAQRYVLEKISQQVDAIITALKATSVWQKEKQARPVQRYKKAVKQVIQSSQELYAELSQNQEFERRLMEMIAIRQDEKINCDKTRADVLNKEILALHTRLGRCRRAITAVEEKIKLAEKSNR